MELGNGPKQDACWKILTPRLEGFVQFYLGTSLHRRGSLSFTYGICYGVQSFVKVVTECGTKASPNQENFVRKMD